MRTASSIPWEPCSGAAACNAAGPDWSRTNLAKFANEVKQVKRERPKRNGLAMASRPSPQSALVALLPRIEHTVKRSRRVIHAEMLPHVTQAVTIDKRKPLGSSVAPAAAPHPRVSALMPCPTLEARGEGNARLDACEAGPI